MLPEQHRLRPFVCHSAFPRRGAPPSTVKLPPSAVAAGGGSEAVYPFTHATLQSQLKTDNAGERACTSPASL